MTNGPKTPTPRTRDFRSSTIDTDILLALHSQRDRYANRIRTSEDGNARTTAALTAKLRETESLIRAIQQGGTRPA